MSGSTRLDRNSPSIPPATTHEPAVQPATTAGSQSPGPAESTGQPATGGFVSSSSDSARTGPQTAPQADRSATEILRDSRPSGAAKSEGLGERAVELVKGKAVELAWKEITKERSFDLAKIDISDRTNVALRGKEKIFKPDDAAVTKDPDKAAYTRRMSEDGKKVYWARTGGLLRLGTGAGTSIGPARVGFSAGSTLEYSTTRPYVPKRVGSTIKKLGANNTIDLPFNAKGALGMEQGTEFSVKGEVRGSATAGTGWGTSVEVGEHFSLGASAGTSHTRSRDRMVGVDVKRLDGDRVSVKLTDLSGKGHSTGVSARAGLKLESDLVPDLGSSKLTDLVEETADKTLKKKVGEWFSAGFSAGASGREEGLELGRYRIDLSTPDGKKAYNALLKGDDSVARDLGRQPNSGVYAATVDEASEASGSYAKANLGPFKLFASNTLRKERDGTLDVGGEVTTYKETEFKKSYSGIFSGDKKIEWEGVTYRTEGEDPQTFFHLKYNNDDNRTTKEEVKDLQSFAELTSAAPVSEPRVAREGGFFKRLFHGKHGETKANADFYFSRAGLTKVAEATDEQVIGAAAETHKAFEGERTRPAWANPARREESLAVVREYQEIKEELDRNVGGEDANDLESSLYWLERKYETRFGRRLKSDSAGWESAERLLGAVDKMRGQPEEEWGQAFANLGSKSKFGFWRDTAALTQLTGTDQMLVHELKMKGENVSIEMKDEGLIQHIDDRIREATRVDGE